MSFSVCIDTHYIIYHAMGVLKPVSYFQSYLQNYNTNKVLFGVLRKNEKTWDHRYCHTLPCTCCYGTLCIRSQFKEPTNTTHDTQVNLGLQPEGFSSFIISIFHKSHQDFTPKQSLRIIP